MPKDNQITTFDKVSDMKKGSVFLIFIAIILMIALGIFIYFFIDTNQNIKKDEDQTNIQDKIVKKVSIIIDDVGINEAILSKLYQTPNVISFAISPYSDQVTKIISQSLAAEREVFITIPMQPYNYLHNDPGPYALLDNLSAQDNIARLKMIISGAQGVTGLHFNHREVFTTSKENLKIILPTLIATDLPVVYYDPDNVKHLLNQRESSQKNLKTIRVDMILDHELEGEIIRRNFDKIIKRAQLYNEAVGVIRPYPLSIDILQEFIPKFIENDVEIVPITKMIVKSDNNTKK